MIAQRVIVSRVVAIQDPTLPRRPTQMFRIRLVDHASFPRRNHIHQFRPQIIRLRGLNQFTQLAVFAKCVEGIVATCASLRCPVIILPIMSVTSAAEARQPMINREIDRYADMLRSLNSCSVSYLEQCKLFGGSGPNDFCITQESVHLNSLGA